MKADFFKLRQQLLAMRHGHINNYAIPGLESSLIGGPEHGTVRYFQCTREHVEPIVAHSHRYDFICLVLKGEVVNRVWSRAGSSAYGDEYHTSQLVYGGDVGKYAVEPQGLSYFSYDDTTYSEGDMYGMTHEEIHSIYFGRDTHVLFFQGPNVSDRSLILEPVVNGKVIPTFKVEPWMFEERE